MCDARAFILPIMLPVSSDCYHSPSAPQPVGKWSWKVQLEFNIHRQTVLHFTCTLCIGTSTGSSSISWPFTSATNETASDVIAQTQAFQTLFTHIDNSFLFYTLKNSFYFYGKKKEEKKCCTNKAIMENATKSSHFTSFCSFSTLFFDETWMKALLQFNFESFYHFALERND